MVDVDAVIARLAAVACLVAGACIAVPAMADGLNSPVVVAANDDVLDIPATAQVGDDQLEVVLAPVIQQANSVHVPDDPSLTDEQKAEKAEIEARMNGFSNTVEGGMLNLGMNSRVSDGSMPVVQGGAAVESLLDMTGGIGSGVFH